MSTTATAPLPRAAAHHIINHVTRQPRAPRASNPKPTANPSKPPQTTSTPKPKPLLTYKYSPRPRPLNPTTHTSTSQIFHHPDHPNHIRIRRRLEAFDPTILHWAVNAHATTSKKAVVRRWAVRRVREAFAAELRERGGGLKGALALTVTEGVLGARGEEVRRECGRVLGEVMGVRGKKLGRREGKPEQRVGRGKSGGESTGQKRDSESVDKSRRKEKRTDGRSQDMKLDAALWKSEEV